MNSKLVWKIYKCIVQYDDMISRRAAKHADVVETLTQSTHLSIQTIIQIILIIS
jgi:hypothetical protein